MTPFDDNDLIDRLQSGIAERQSGISAPDGIGDQARRAARKRTTRRAAGAGVPVLAAGVATVLAVSSGSKPPAASGLSVGGSSGSSGSSGSGLSAPTGSVKAEDTAYIVKRVKANVAASQGGTVIHGDSYASGDVSPDGSLVNLGWNTDDQYDYAAPDGTRYTRSEWNDEDGSTSLIGSWVLIPDGKGDGKATGSRTLIDPATHTYSQTQFSGDSDPGAGLPTPNLYSSASKVQQALQSGQVTQKGMAMINGTQARALSVTVNVPAVSPSVDLTLYVNAQTYQPLRTVTMYGGLPDLLVSDWIPATPDNIAKAEDDSIPAGYTKVDGLVR